MTTGDFPTGVSDQRDGSLGCADGIVVVSGDSRRGGQPGLAAPKVWDTLKAEVSGRLIMVESPLQACKDNLSGPDCATALENLQNPFFNEDEPGATQTTGWMDAWTAAVSPYAVAAESAQAVAAAVNFARQHGVRLVVKGTGHDYLGRSNAPDSLLIWTHNMRDVTVHDAFTITGGAGEAMPAISVGAGTRWLEAHVAATQHAATSRAVGAPASAPRAASSRAAASAASRSGSAPVRRGCSSTRW